MDTKRLCSRAAWLLGGLLLGVIITLFWPSTPLHAVATDRIDTFAMATGPVDDEVEAVYFLDMLTGDLRAFVVGRQTGKFQAAYSYNVMRDLGVDPAKNPKFMMATGLTDLRRGRSPIHPSRSICYVSEVTSGNVGAFMIPWSPAVHASAQIVQQQMVCLHVIPFRAAVKGS